MTRLRFIIVSLLGAVAGCLGWRRKLTRADFTVEIQRVDDYQGDGPRVLMEIIDRLNQKRKGYVSCKLDYYGEATVRRNLEYLAELEINTRIKELSA